MEELIIKVEVPEELKEEYKEILERLNKEIVEWVEIGVLQEIINKRGISVKNEDFWKLVKEVKKGVARKHGLE
ncbi:MAG: hypothetical protein ACPLN2_07525 [Thermoproteota archaeon]